MKYIFLTVIVILAIEITQVMIIQKQYELISTANNALDQLLEADAKLKKACGINN